jgi:uncharacterized protein (DUF362 family)
MSRIFISYRKEIPETPAEFSEASLQIIREMTEEAVAPFNFSEMVKGKKVLIKPNFVRPNYHFNPAVCSDPRAVLSLGCLAKDAGAVKVCVGDNPGVGLSFRKALNDIPGFALWKQYGIEPFCYEDYPIIEVDLSEAELFPRMKVPSGLLDFEVFINLAKLKMHMHVGASLGIKNLYGLLLDEQRMSFHRQDVNRKLIEILRRFRPDLTIVEGIWALEGQAPICGDPVKDFNTIIAGTDPVAVDTVASRIIGFHPEEIATNRLAQAYTLGEGDLSKIEISGAPLSRVERHLKRAVVSSMGVYPNCEVYELGACVGCMSSLRHALDRLHYAGELEKFPPATFVLGVPGPFYHPLTKWKGILWLIGDCLEQAYGEADNIRRVKGCPPHFGEIIRALKGN